MAAQQDLAVDDPTQGRRLRSGAIGVFGLVFMVVAATAPLTALASNLSISLAFGVGAGTVFWLIVVAALMAAFAAGFVVLARYVTNAGAYYAFIGYGLGRPAGAASAFVALVAYNMAAGGMAAATGFFASVTLGAWGFEVPWYVCALLAVAIIGYLGVRGVSVAQGVTTAISLAQFALVLLLSFAIVVQRPGGWSFDVLSPSTAMSGNVALTLVFCLLSFNGFEASASYGEEAKAARRSIRTATYIALSLLVAMAIFSTWALVAAFPDVNATAMEDPGMLVFRTADMYLGAWSGKVLSTLVTLSFLAAGVAFHNMAARYFFALGRSRLLPGSLSGVHRRFGSPSVGSYVQTILSVVLIAPFALLGADPIVNLFPIVAGITSLSITGLMVGCSLSAVVAGLRGRFTESAFQTIVAPAVAAVGMTVAIVVILMHYQEVTGSDSLVIALMPLIPLAAGVYGAWAAATGRGDALEDYLHE